MPQALTFDPARLPRSRDLGEPVRPICVGLEPADLRRLDALSLAQRVNRSALVRRAVRAMLAASTGKGKNEPVKNGDAQKGTQ